jgi:ATP-dependent Clp protease protease subunit
MILFLHGEVTKTSTKAFLDSIQDEPLEVHIDSIGGDLFEGLKIYNTLKNHKQEVEIVIDGVAGSVASVIALAGTNTTISKTGSVMIHNALTPEASGNHNDLKKIANTLEQYSNIIAGVYAENTKLSFDEALELMNLEQTFTPDEAVKLGFASSINEPLKAVAKINKIDMNLLETIKAKLNGEEVPEVLAEETVTEETTTTEEGGASLTEEEIRIIIAEMIAEALAGNTEEVGATIATVLNSITSEGNPIQDAGTPAVEVEVPVDGVSAFYKKMKEIKSKNIKS